MEFSNGAVIHSPVGLCMEMKDRRTGEEEEEEDEVELAEEVDEDINIGDDDGGESNTMPSTDVIIHKTDEEDIMEDEEDQVGQETVVLQKELNAGETEEEEVDITYKLATHELQATVELPTTTQLPGLQNEAEELGGTLKELDKARADHMLETLYEDDKESDEPHMQSLSKRQTETEEFQELLLSKVREFTCSLLEKVKNKHREDQIQQVKSDILLQEEEHEEVKVESLDDEGVKNDVDEEPRTVCTSEGEPVENVQGLGEEEEPVTFDNVGEEQSTTEVHLVEDCIAAGEPMHNDAFETNSDEKTTYYAPEERSIDWIATEQASTDMIGGTIEEMAQNSDQLVESIMQEHDRLESIGHVVSDTNLENCERIVADTKSAIVNGPGETRGANKEVDGMERIQDEPQRVVEIIEELVKTEELPIKEGSCTNAERLLDDPEVVEEGVYKKQEQLGNRKREVAGDAAKEQPKQKVIAPLEEGAGNWLEELKAVIEDEPRRKAQGGRKVTIPAWLKANESSDAHFQEPPKPLGSRVSSVSRGSKGEVNIKTKVQEVIMANGCPGRPAAVVQQEEEKPPENMTKMQTSAQQEGNPHGLQISLYVKVLSIVNSQIMAKIDLYIGVLEVNEIERGLKL